MRNGVKNSMNTMNTMNTMNYFTKLFLIDVPM